MDDIENYFIRLVEVNGKGEYRITRKALLSLYEDAIAVDKLPLLQILVDDYTVNVKFDKDNGKNYIPDDLCKTTALISKQTVNDLINFYQTDTEYEIMEDEDFTWNLTIQLEKKERI